ncbi:MAG TPA: chromate resistance protein ChrB domain-containing protein [Albitalea sp.]
MWSVLIVTLPTQPGAVRLRIWRALKALGCGALRDGAYVLPSSHAGELDKLAEEVRAHAGSASVLELRSRTPEQEAEIGALFDRAAAYGEWRGSLQQLRAELASLGETEARRRLRAVAEALQAIVRIDYVPGTAQQQAQADLAALRLELDARFSADEPHAGIGAVKRLDRRKYSARRWATRARPWVDRLACCWLIVRFIDPQPSFVWLDDVAKLPRGAVGFDFDGAAFTHVDTLVSFEVMMASFGLDDDLPLQRIAAAVHYLDVGGIPAPEAAGLETILCGLRDLHADDDALVAASNTVFDAMYAAHAAQGERR